MDQYQFFKDYEVMSVSCVIAGLLFSQLGQPWATYGLFAGFVSALLYHRFGGTYPSILAELYPELQETEFSGRSSQGSTHAA